MPAAVADLDGDGDKEIIFTSFDMRCYCLDARGNKLWEFVTEGGPQDEPPTKPPVNRTIDCAATIADLDGDGMYEILFTTHDEDYTSYLYVLTHDGKLLWKYPILPSYSDPAVADINNDGILEIVTGDMEGNVYAFDAYGNEIWSTKITGRAHIPSIADLNGDGYKEIITGTVVMGGAGDGYVYILSHDGKILWQYHAGSKQMSYDIPVCDINGDGTLELIAGFEDGRVIAFSPMTGTKSYHHISGRNLSVKHLFLSTLTVMMVAFAIKKR